MKELGVQIDQNNEDIFYCAVSDEELEASAASDMDSASTSNWLLTCCCCDTDEDDCE